MNIAPLLSPSVAAPEWLRDFDHDWTAALQTLSPVETHERKRMEYYWANPFHHPGDERPLIRLACQSIASGSVSIVLPTWNGVWSATRRDALARQAPV